MGPQNMVDRFGKPALTRHANDTFDRASKRDDLDVDNGIETTGVPDGKELNLAIPDSKITKTYEEDTGRIVVEKKKDTAIKPGSKHELDHAVVEEDDIGDQWPIQGITYCRENNSDLQLQSDQVQHTFRAGTFPDVDHHDASATKKEKPNKHENRSEIPKVGPQKEPESESNHVNELCEELHNISSVLAEIGVGLKTTSEASAILAKQIHHAKRVNKEKELVLGKLQRQLKRQRAELVDAETSQAKLDQEILVANKKLSEIGPDLLNSRPTFVANEVVLNDLQRGHDSSETKHHNSKESATSSDFDTSATTTVSAISDLPSQDTPQKAQASVSEESVQSASSINTSLTSITASPTPSNSQDVSVQTAQDRKAEREQRIRALQARIALRKSLEH